MAIVVAGAWLSRLPLTDWTGSNGRQWEFTQQVWRLCLGTLLALMGAWLWIDGSVVLSADWVAGFDRGWLSWIIAAGLVGLGLRIAQEPRSLSGNGLSRWEWLTLAGALVAAAVFRLINYDHFPPHNGVSQVEELQAGLFGNEFLLGDRRRWEFIGQAWLGALSLWIGGPTLVSVRIAYSIVAALKVLPVYFWFRAMAGPTGAMVGTSLLAVSAWDTIVNRIPGQHDGLVIASCFALLVGPATRGAMFVYPWVAFLSGYTFYTYVAYRPLILLAFVGATIAGFARRHPGRLGALRALAAPVFVGAVLVAMFLPLTYRLSQEPGQFNREYFNGWNRARAIQPYYGPEDSLGTSIRKRWERTLLAVGLFYTKGDDNPARNVNERPLIDAVTGSLLILGVGYCVLAFLHGFYGVVLVAFVATFVGTLVVSGDFNPLRGAATIPYVYALAAVGAGALSIAAGHYWGRQGSTVIGGILIGGVLWAVSWNGMVLRDLWGSAFVRQHYRNDIAYLSDWLRRNASGHQVIGLIPNGASVIFRGNDGSWLLGREVKGVATLDVPSTLRAISQSPEDGMLVLFSDTHVRDPADYFEAALPGLQLTAGPEDPTGTRRITYGLLDALPATLKSARFRQFQCKGIHARFRLLRANGEVIVEFQRLVPFIDSATWPAELRSAAEQHAGEADSIQVSWDGEFEITVPGTYRFRVDVYDGNATAAIDDDKIGTDRLYAVDLHAGSHRFTMRGQFRPSVMEPTGRLRWDGPATGGDLRVVPFYRLTSIDPTCSTDPSI